MKKSRSHKVAFMAVFVLLAACTAPQATPTGSPPATPVVVTTPTGSPPVVVTTPTPPPDPAAACSDCWPLSGKPAQPGAVDKRPLVVKIDNAPAARPHFGITQADIVFEILVEGFVTRLAAVFHSQDPQSIGNIRSARLADRSIAPMVRGALAYSGTSAYEMPLIQDDAAQGKYVDLSADYTAGYYRVSFRLSPYNLFTSAQAMRQAIAAKGADGPQTVPSWGFLARSDHVPTIAGMAGAVPATDVTIPYRADSSRASYQYDAQARTYARSQNNAGKPIRELDGANNEPVAASNIVVIRTEIWEVPEIVDASGAHGHDMRLTGTGTATIFRDGLRQEATWSRAGETDPFMFKNAAGERILLAPGQTWVHVIPNDWEVSSP